MRTAPAWAKCPSTFSASRFMPGLLSEELQRVLEQVQRGDVTGLGDGLDPAQVLQLLLRLLEALVADPAVDAVDLEPGHLAHARAQHRDRGLADVLGPDARRLVGIGLGPAQALDVA